MNPSVETALRIIGTTDDADIDIADAALVLAWAGNPTVNIERYRNHLMKIEDAMTEAVSTEIFDGTPDEILKKRIEIINGVLFRQFSYTAGDEREFSNVGEADMFRVIDRRKGIPILLGILYIYAARTQDWLIEGLNFPSRFLVRMGSGSARRIIDVFSNGKAVDAGGMRAIAKSILGPTAELDHRYYDTMSNRDILLRAVNHVKFHLIEDEHYDKALEWVETMKMIAPDEMRLYFDSGVLNTRLGNYSVAVEDLNIYIDNTDDMRSKQEAEFLLLGISELLRKK